MSVDTGGGRRYAYSTRALARLAPVLMAIAAIGAKAEAVLECQLIPNGSFTDGLAGWTADPTIVQTPGAKAGASALVVSGAPLDPPMDEQVARLFVGASTYPEPTGGASASASMLLRRAAPLTHRYLKFTHTGFFGTEAYANGEFTLNLTINVHGPGASVVSRVLLDYKSFRGPTCEEGLASDGFFGYRDPDVVLDVLAPDGTPSGISIGDSVQIEVILSCAVGALDVCDEADVFALLFLDQFQFCDDVSDCQLVPNGSFTDGRTGWTWEPTLIQQAGAFAGVGYGVVDGGALVLPLDEHVASLLVSASTDLDEPTPAGGNFSSASLRFHGTATVTDRYLRFTQFGDWGTEWYANGHYAVNLTISVYGPDGAVVSRVLTEFKTFGTADCETGLAADGYFGFFDSQVVLDMLFSDGTPTGISISDAVEIEVVLNGLTGALDECDEASVYAQVFLDEFRFCRAVTVPADLNQDGVVNTLDLGILLASWSLPDRGLGCTSDAPCAADLDQNFFVDTIDLGILLSSWTL